MILRAQTALIAVLLLGGTARAAEWKWVGGLNCAQIKVNGKGLRDATVTIYQASSEDKSCCQADHIAEQTRTRRSGYFEARKLKPGYHFVVFEKASARIVVPVQVKFSSAGACPAGERNAIIQVNDKTGEIKVDNFVIVD